MLNKLYVTLTERGGAKAVSYADWNSAGCNNEAIELARAGILKIEDAGVCMLITPKTFAGVFDSPRLQVQVKSKAPELTSTLTRLLSQWRRTLSQQNHLNAGTDFATESIWATFEYLLNGMLREGLPWEYSNNLTIASNIRGKIRLKESISEVFSKGINHKIAFCAPTRKHQEELGPALDAVRRKISSIESSSTKRRFHVSRLLELIGDLSPPTTQTQASAVLRSLSENENRPALSALCKFGIEVLGEKPPFTISQQIGSGIAEFVDLEKLWEHAVHLSLTQSFTTLQPRLHPLRGSNITLFDDGGPEIDPDIIAYQDQLPEIIADAKYSIASSPPANDVYQISSYVQKLNCKLGLLVYVAEGSKTVIRKIGTLPNGAQLFACCLAIDAFELNGTTRSTWLTRSALEVPEY